MSKRIIEPPKRLVGTFVTEGVAICDYCGNSKDVCRCIRRTYVKTFFFFWKEIDLTYKWKYQ